MPRSGRYSLAATNDCCWCKSECDGTFMRTDPRYSRVRTMLLSEDIPRRPSGGIALCHVCQRSVYFSGGFLEMVQQYLYNMAKYKVHRK